MPSLAVTVDPNATLRQARRGTEPDPVTAALMAELAGARCIICHLREDRRHIQDRDLDLLRATVQTRLNLEMAATDEMLGICLRTRPDIICLVPEKRQELTTEGGLDVAGRTAFIRDYLRPVLDAGIETSLFVDADPARSKPPPRPAPDTSNCTPDTTPTPPLPPPQRPYWNGSWPPSVRAASWACRSTSASA